MLAEDDKIHNVNDEKVEEEPATEGDDEDSQEDGMIGICDPYHCHSLSPSLCAPRVTKSYSLWTPGYHFLQEFSFFGFLSKKKPFNEEELCCQPTKHSTYTITPDPVADSLPNIHSTWHRTYYVMSSSF